MPQKPITQQFRDSLTLPEDSRKTKAQKSIAWYRQTVRETIRTKRTNVPLPGRLMTFAYDAKHKDTLPYWDVFPLTLIMNVMSGRMNGLNLHYLPPNIRVKFLEMALDIFGTANNLTQMKRLYFTWDQIKTLPYAKFAIKQYIYPRVIGKILREVHPTEWHNAVYLPIQSFESKGRKISPLGIWNQARKNR